MALLLDFHWLSGSDWVEFYDSSLSIILHKIKNVH